MNAIGRLTHGLTKVLPTKKRLSTIGTGPAYLPHNAIDENDKTNEPDRDRQNLNAVGDRESRRHDNSVSRDLAVTGADHAVRQQDRDDHRDITDPPQPSITLPRRAVIGKWRANQPRPPI